MVVDVMGWGGWGIVECKQAKNGALLMLILALLWMKENSKLFSAESSNGTLNLFWVHVCSCCFFTSEVGMLTVTTWLKKRFVPFLGWV